MSDEAVLAASQAELAPADDQRLSLLLDRQQAGLLTGAEQGELAGLMCLYQNGLLGKAHAIREAVRRGLMEPLSPPVGIRLRTDRFAMQNRRP